MITDDELASSLRAIARSGPPVPNGRGRVLTRVTWRRRRRRAVLGAVAVALVVGAGLLTVRDTRHDLQPAATSAVLKTTIDERDGVVAVVMTVRYPERRLLVRADEVIQNRSHRSGFRPRDASNLDFTSLPSIPSQRSPLVVAAGVPVDIGGVFIPDCAEPPGVPVLSVTTRIPGGPSVRDRHAVADLAAYRSAFAKACRGGLHAEITEVTLQPQGGSAAGVYLVNPGPDPLTVTSEDYVQDGEHWRHASVTVAPGREATLAIPATGAGCRSHTPWTTGHLYVDGEPLHLTGRPPGC